MFDSMAELGVAGFVMAATAFLLHAIAKFVVTVRDKRDSERPQKDRQILPQPPPRSELPTGDISEQTGRFNRADLTGPQQTISPENVPSPDQAFLTLMSRIDELERKLESAMKIIGKYEQENRELHRRLEKLNVTLARLETSMQFLGSKRRRYHYTDSEGPES